MQEQLLNLLRDQGARVLVVLPSKFDLDRYATACASRGICYKKAAETLVCEENESSARLVSQYDEPLDLAGIQITSLLFSQGVEVKPFYLTRLRCPSWFKGSHVVEAIKENK
jgi:hypothetical protein